MFNFNPYEVKNNVKITFLTESDSEKLLSNNSYFRFILTYGSKFCSFLNCADVTSILSRYGYKAYNYKLYWEERNIPFEKAIMLYLLSKIEPFSSTVGKIGDHYISEEAWVVDMYQKTFIKMAFQVSMK